MYRCNHHNVYVSSFHKRSAIRRDFLFLTANFRVFFFSKCKLVAKFM